MCNLFIENILILGHLLMVNISMYLPFEDCYKVNALYFIRY